MCLKFGCFVDGCDRMCSTPFKRKRHLIDKHQFPDVNIATILVARALSDGLQNYNFFVTKDGIDRSNSLLVEPSRSKSNHDHRNARGGKSKHTPSIAQLETDEDTARPSSSRMATHSVAQTGPGGPDADVAMNEISGLMSAMRFVPTTVRFGRRR
jgi:hypothetical protein